MITPGIESQDPSLGNIQDQLGEPSKDPLDFAFIQIGFSDDTTILNIPPENLISFVHENTINTEADTFTLEVFDATWSQFEELLIKQQNNLKFRFGWAKGHQSQWRQATIVKHTPTFEVNGVRISIQGFDRSIIANEKSKTKEWKKTYIHEIVEEIANYDENKWHYDSSTIARTKIVPDENGDPQRFVQYQMPDMTFIKEVLLKFARLENDPDKTGFSCWLDSTSNTVFFRPPSLDAPVTKSYIVYRHYMGEVIRFSPELGDGAIQRKVGALNLRTTGLDPFKREVYDVVVDNSSTTGKVVNGEFVADQPITSVGSAGRFLYTAALTEEAASLEAKQRWYKRFNMFFTAELEVVGDPHITPGTNIGILVLDSESRPHYCSGKFYVAGVTHNINNGSYTSTISLWKNALREGAVDVKQKGYGQVASDWETISQILPFWVPPEAIAGASPLDLYQLAGTLLVP